MTLEVIALTRAAVGTAVRSGLGFGSVVDAATAAPDATS